AAPPGSPGAPAVTAVCTTKGPRPCAERSCGDTTVVPAPTPLRRLPVGSAPPRPAETMERQRGATTRACRYARATSPTPDLLGSPSASTTAMRTVAMSLG